MSLLAIKQHMMKVRIASFQSICAYFNQDQTLLRQMLGHWIRKGCLRKMGRSAACESCKQCGELVTEVYEWVAIN